MRNYVLVILATAALTTTGLRQTISAQQAPDWSHAFYPQGILGNVANLFVYRGDLIAVGSLGAAGTVGVNGAARWDGNRWNKFLVDSGYAYFPSSRGLLVSQQYVRENGAWSGRVLRWDGSQWTQLGGDLDIASRFIEYQGQLFAAGNIGGVYKLVNNEWQPVPFSNSRMSPEAILSFTVFREKLYAGGNFFFGEYDGTAFRALLHDQWVGIKDMQAHQGYLVAAGEFSDIDGAPASNIARWDGATWSSLGMGLSGGYPGYGRVDRLGLYRGDLIALGAFHQAGGQDNAAIARWNGERWSSIGLQRSPFGASAGLQAMAIIGDSLFVAGGFSQVTGKTARGVAVWNGNDWKAVVSGMGKGLDGQINASIVFNGMLIVGGDFSRAGPISARHIAAWTGNEWRDLGGGVDDDVEALTVWNNKLIAAGYFHHAGGRPAQRIAAWDGTHWEPLGSGMEYAILGVGPYREDLIAVGYFSEAGGVPASRVAAWNGSHWRPLGAGMDPGTVGQAAGTSVLVYGDNLIVGGSFARIGDIEAHNIASWDGMSWKALGSGTDGGVAALSEWNGSLMVSGAFGKAGGVNAPSIAAWDGFEWHAMGDGPQDGADRAYVKCMTLYGGELVVGGRFSQAGGARAGGIAVWDGATWRPFGQEHSEGFWNYGSAYVNTLTEFLGNLYAGGQFVRVEEMPSAYFAEWRVSERRPNPSPPLMPPISASETRGEVALPFSLPEPGDVSLDVFDLSGRKVASQGSASFPSGDNQLLWNGKDRFGRRLPQGIYFARLSLPSRVETHRILIRH